MSEQKNRKDTPRQNSTKEKNLRKESDKMMKDAEEQENALPRGGEPIGGA